MNDADWNDQRNGLGTPTDHISDERLSVYIDERDSLSDAERREIEQHLQGCSDCQQALADLESIVGALRTLPLIEVPRSFYLTQDIVEDLRQEITVLRDPAPFYIRHIGTLRAAAAVAAVIFVFVLGADLLTNNFTNNSDADNALPVNAAIERSSVATDSDAAAAESEDSASDGADEQATEMLSAESEEESAAGDSSESLAPPISTPANVEGATADSGTALATSQTTVEESDSFGDEGQNTAAYDSAAETETVPQADDQGDSRTRYFRIAEVGLVFVFVSLLGFVVILPRLERSRRS